MRSDSLLRLLTPLDAWGSMDSAARCDHSAALLAAPFTSRERTRGASSLAASVCRGTPSPDCTGVGTGQRLPEVLLSEEKERRAHQDQMKGARLRTPHTIPYHQRERWGAYCLCFVSTAVVLSRCCMWLACRVIDSHARNCANPVSSVLLDLQSDSGLLPCRLHPQKRADRLDGSSLFPNDPAHVFRGDLELQEQALFGVFAGDTHLVRDGPVPVLS